MKFADRMKDYAGCSECEAESPRSHADLLILLFAVLTVVAYEAHILFSWYSRWQFPIMPVIVMCMGVMMYQVIVMTLGRYFVFMLDGQVHVHRYHPHHSLRLKNIAWVRSRWSLQEGQRAIVGPILSFPYRGKLRPAKILLPNNSIARIRVSRWSTIWSCCIRDIEQEYVADSKLPRISLSGISAAHLLVMLSEHETIGRYLWSREMSYRQFQEVGRDIAAVRMFLELTRKQRKYSRIGEHARELLEAILFHPHRGLRHEWMYGADDRLQYMEQQLNQKKPYVESA